MEKTIEKITNELVKENKKILSIYMHGSSSKLNLEDYSDIDLVILCEELPPKKFYVELHEINGKKVLMSFSFVKYNPNINPLDYSVVDIIFSLHSFQNSKLLYDKGNFYETIKNSFSALDLEKKQIITFPFYFNIFVDCYYKIKRTIKRKNYEQLKIAAKEVADKSLKLINCFNKIIINKNSNFNPKNLTNKPNDYDNYFYIVSGLKDSKSFEKLSEACLKLIEETLLFLKCQDLSKINDEQFSQLFKKVLTDINPN